MVINNCYKNSILLLVLIGLSSCASVPKFTSKNDNKLVEKAADPDAAKKPEAENIYNDNEEVAESIIGLASFYDEPFHGRQTSNGEIYDKYGFTAAHNSWPFNTIVKVTNLNNNKSVKIRINDRMPKHPARIIDLSYGTALQLDMLNDGVVKVRLDILKWGEE